MYTAIWTTFGGLHVHVFEDKEELLNKLEDELHGVRWVTPRDFDWQKANNGLIFKGRPVFPKEKRVVKEYDID